MRIVHVSISRFRGIQSLAWKPGPFVNCLIGPGDSSKTTILDAIEIGLSPRYGYTGSDADFFECDFSHPVEIITTLSDLPEEFVLESRYGLHLRGWNADTGTINDEKKSADVEALSIRAVLSPETLEWSWFIHNERVDATDPPTFKLRDGAIAAPARLGPYADRHLTWGRNSTLTRIVGTQGVAPELVRANRSTKAGFDLSGQPAIDAAIAQAHAAASRFAVRRKANYSAKLDVQSIAVTSSAVSLHEGDLPLRMLGTGSSRLLVAGIQHELGSGRIVLVDEVEHGLEPHRVHRLLGLLRETKDTSAAQVFMTTHSPVVICELNAGELLTVRRNTTCVAVNAVGMGMKDDAAQRHVRGHPGAFLAPRILVCEGRTEQGLMRTLDTKWVQSGADSFASKGVAIIDGGGRDPAVTLSLHLAQLGYEVCVFLDTDQPISTEQRGNLAKEGCKIIEWTGAASTEVRVFGDLPILGVQSLVSWAVDHFGEGFVAKSLNATKQGGGNVWTSVEPSSITDLPENRRHLVRASMLEEKNTNGKTTHKAWFKSIVGGEALGEVIFENWNEIAATPLGNTLKSIQDWVDEHPGA